MAHPVGNEHRAHKVMKDRVAHIAGKATGGSSHSDVAEDKALIRQMVKKAAMRADGGAVRARADKVARAKGGRVKGTTVNVIVAPKGQDTPPPMAAMPPPMPPKPPMPVPAPAAMGPSPVAGLGGMPPMPPRSDGGRAYKRGGRVKRAEGGDVEWKPGDKPTYSYPVGKPGEKPTFSYPIGKPGEKPRYEELKRGGAAKGKMSGEKKHGKGKFKMRWKGGAVSDSSEGGTQVQHSGNKSDGVNIGRGPVITRATGGPIYADGRKGKQMSWNKPSMGLGGGGGKERKAAARRLNPAGHEPWTKDHLD